MGRRACALLSVLLALALLMGSALAEGVLVIAGEESGQSLSGGEELKPEERVKMDGYAIKFEDAKWYTDEKLYSGGWLGYHTSSENGAALLRYRYPVGTHVPFRTIFEFTNMSKEDVDLLERVSCRVEFDDQYVFDDFLIGQYNPDQLADDGESARPSTEAVSIEPLLSVEFAVTGALPMYVRDSDAPLVMYLMIDGADVFEVDLREYIEFYE